MPEGYTHVKMAAKAVNVAQVPLTSQRAFALGANGPDPFFFYQAWMPSRRRTWNLFEMGERMHREKTGEFLQCMLRHASTRVQWDYTLGFLCHYGVDALVHPYVAAIQKPGQPYYRPSGHGLFEIGLDSHLYALDYGPGGIPAPASTPAVSMGQQLQIAGLLQECIREVYGRTYPLEVIRRSFIHMRSIRTLLSDPGPVMKGLFWVAERFVGKGIIFAHVTPAPLDGLTSYPRLPSRWENPYTQEMCQGDVFDLLAQSVDRCALLVRAAYLWKEGELTWEQLTRVVGSKSYETGLTVE